MDQVELAPIVLRGGSVFITANVISTGGGSIEAIDGLGSLSITSQISNDLVLNAVDLGDGVSQQGLIRITDLSKRFVHPTTSKTYFEITEYRSLNGVTKEYSNRNADNTVSYEDDPTTPTVIEEIVPNRYIRDWSAGTAQYGTTAGRDLALVTEQTRLIKMARFTGELVHGSGAIRETYGVTDILCKPIDPAPTSWFDDDYVGYIPGTFKEFRSFSQDIGDDYAPVQASTNGNDYNYKFTLSNKQVFIPTIQIPLPYGTVVTVLAPGPREFDVPKYGGGTRARLDPIMQSGLLNSYATQISSSITNREDIRANRLENIGTGSNPRKGTYYNKFREDVLTRSSAYNFFTGVTSEYDSSQHHNHLLIYQQAYLYAETIHHEHRFKADKAIDIRFSSGAGATASVLAAGNIILNHGFENVASATSITSTGGSILAANTNAVIRTQNLTLRADNGSIGTQNAAIAIALNSGSSIDASARDFISLNEVSGAMNVVQAKTTARATTNVRGSLGDISLRAVGAITQANPAAAISGSAVTPVSEQAHLGTTAQALNVDTNNGPLSATAQNDVIINEISGDLALGTVTSLAGNVHISAAAGAIVDRNDSETKDVRTEQQLLDLWSSDLGLTDATRANDRGLEQIAAFEERKTQAYRTYWLLRDAAGGGPISYVMDANTRAGLIAGLDMLDVTQAALAGDTIASYEAEQDALYTDWNLQGAQVAGYRYTATAAETTAIAGDLLWTVAELTQNISAGLFAFTGDTNTRIEAANVTAKGDITLTSFAGIGDTSAPYVIAAVTDANGNTTPPLNAADVVALSAALPGNLTIDATGNITIIQQDDVNFEFRAFTGTASDGLLRATSQSGDIFLASEKGARIASLVTPGNLVLKLDGDMIDAGPLGTATLRAANISIESGKGAIGTSARALSLSTGANGFLRLAGDKDISVAAQSAVSISSAFSNAALTLTSTGAITDYFTTDATRVVAKSISLTGTEIGTSSNVLTLFQTDDAAGDTSLNASTGAIYAASQSAMRLRALNAASEGRLTVQDTGTLSLIGANTVRVGLANTLVISTAGRVDTTLSTGTDFTAKALQIVGGSDWGAPTSRIKTAVETLDITTLASVPATQAWNVYLDNTGDLTLASLAQAAGSLVDISTVGTFTADTLALASAKFSSTGAMTLNALTASGSFAATSLADPGATTLTSGGDMSLAGLNVTGTALNGAAVSVASTATQSLTDVIAETLSATATGVATIQNATVQTAMVLTAGGTLDVTTASAATAMLNSTGVMTLNDLTTTGSLTATAVDDLSATDVSSASALTLAGGTVVGKTLSGTTVNVTSTAGQTLSDVSATNATLNSAGALTVNTIQTRDALSMTSTGAMSATDVSATTALLQSAGMMTLGTVKTIGALSATATGTLNATDVSSASALTLAGGTVVGKTLSGTTVNVTSTGGQTLSDVSATSATLNSAGAMSATDVTAGSLNVTAGQAATLVNATVTSALTLTGGSTLDLTNASAATALLNSTSIMTLNDLTTTGSLSATATGALVATDLTAGTDVSLTGRTVTANTVSSKDLTVVADTSILLETIRTSARVDLIAQTIMAQIADSTGRDGLVVSVQGANGSHAETVNLAVTDSALLHLTDSLFTLGDIRTFGSVLRVSETNILSSAWFRTQDLDLFAERTFSALQLDADIQLIAMGVLGGSPGDLDFTLFSGLELETQNLLLNKKDRQLAVNGLRDDPQDTSFVINWLTPRLLDQAGEDDAVFLNRGLIGAGNALIFGTQDVSISGSAFAPFAQSSAQTLPIVIVQ